MAGAGDLELGDIAITGMAVDLLSAGYAEGGKRKVILSPAIVGLLTHEAIGHTSQAVALSADW